MESDDIWEEYQEGECMSCGNSSHSCDCYEVEPVTFDESSYSVSEGITTWAYVYCKDKVGAQGDVQYDKHDDEYTITIDVITESDEIDSVKKYIYSAIKEKNEKD